MGQAHRAPATSNDAYPALFPTPHTYSMPACRRNAGIIRHIRALAIERNIQENKRRTEGDLETYDTGTRMNV